MGIHSAFFRFYFDSADPTRDASSSARPSGSRWAWRRSASSSGSRSSGAISTSPLRHDRRQRARHGRVRRPLGGHELRAGHLALPSRGAVGRVRLGEPHEHLPDHRRDAPPRRRPRQGADRRDRRQLHRHAARVRRSHRIPARAARPPVRPRPPAADEPLRRPARADRALPLGDELLRPALPREARGHAGGRPLLGRRAHRLRDGAAAHGVPPRMARVRVLDRGRPGGAAHVRVRADLPRARDDLGGDGPRAPLALDRRVDRGAGVRELVARRRPARLLDGRVRRLHRRRDRRRTREADAVQLGRDGRGSGREHRAEPAPDPAATG